MLVDAQEPPALEDGPELILDTLGELAEGFLRNLPLIVIGALLLVVGVFVARWVARGAEHALDRTRADAVVVRLVERLVNIAVLIAFLLLALAVAGVDVGAAIAGLGIAGLALAFALQNILENFVAGLLLMLRKPFIAGDQIISGDFEGTVEEIDLRVTRILTYDGEEVRIPNADIYKSPLTNLTRRGKRRTRVPFGVDYRDDHTAVIDLVLPAVRNVEGVLENPTPVVIMTGLGASSVDFELRFWSRPDIATVLEVQTRVLLALKSAIEDGGMTIPWPIRTLSFDNAVELQQRSGA